MFNRKERINQHIKTCLSRKETYKKLYGAKHPLYTKKCKRLNQTLKNLRKRYDRLTAQEKYVRSIAKMVCLFLGVDTLWQTGPIHGPSPKAKNIVLAKCLLCKYVIENSNSKSYALCQYLGVALGYAGKIRLRFTRSFATKPENKKHWEAFKLFIKDVDQDPEILQGSETPPREKIVYKGKYYNTYRELAEELGINTNAAWKRVKNAAHEGKEVVTGFFS